MDFREDLEFHDDSGRMTDKAKESILLMKKKMFRSHDLILQYNNIMKECDRLKGDLCMAQEEMVKFQKDSHSKNSKIMKLEMQISNQNKSRQELEQKIAEQDIKIAGDKSHVDQLICKLKELENKHSGMLIEVDITKSSLKDKIKGLECELKKLKKSQPVDSEKSFESPKGKKSLKKNQTLEKETVDVGVNTTQENIQKIEMKVITSEKSTMTNEFYHIKDNPYPIFCHNCQSLTKPNIDQFFKTMTYHPPMLDEIVSPPPPLPPLPRIQKLTNCDVSNVFIEPLESIEQNEMRNSVVKLVTPEIENLKQKITTLERKIKKKNKQTFKETQQPCGNCCGHPYQANHCSMLSSNHGAVTQPIPPDIQTKWVAEIVNQLMNSASKNVPRTKNSWKRGRIDKKKSLNFIKGKMKVSMKRKIKKCVSSSNWEVESDDCGNEMESNAEVGHLLRLKPSNDFIQESPVTNENQTRAESVPKIVVKPESRSKDRESKLEDSFNDDDDNGDGPVEDKTDTNMVLSKNSPRRTSSRIHEKSLRTREIEEKTTSTPVRESLSVSVDRSPIADESLNETNARISACPSENSIIGESKPSKILSTSVSRIDRSMSCSPSHASRKNFQFEDKQQNTDIDVDANEFYSDSDLNVPINSSPRNIRRKLRSEVFGNDVTDEEKSFSQPLQEKNTRKRKRSNSPTRNNRSVKTKLLYKLRNLKKNTTILVPKSSPNINNRSAGTCSSQTDETCNKFENVEHGDAPIKESSIEMTAKKQRIAHVPKRSLSKERDCMQETRVGLEKDQIEPEKDQNLDEISVKEMPRAEVQGTHRSLDKLKGISLMIEKPKDTVISIKTPRTRNSSKLGKCSEKLEDNSLILEEKNEPCTKTHLTLTEKIEKTEIFTEKIFDAVPIPETASECNDNILSNSHLCKSEENSEWCEKDEEEISKNHSTEMPENEEMEVETKEISDPEQSSVEIRDAAPSDAEMKTSLKSIDESPASPDGSKILDSSNSYPHSTTLPEKHVMQESIYETAVLPDTISSDGIPFSQPSVGARSLIKYDTVLFEDFGVHDEETDSHMSSDPQFVDNSDTTIKKEKSHSNNRKKTQAIVKDLRTRKVLCSPVKSVVVHQQDQQNLTTLDNDSSDRTGLVSNCRGIRSLETLLTRHLGTLKNNKPTRAKTLRKMAAAKLQTDAEKSVRTELDNLVGNEEWSSAIHTSVVTKLCQVPSQRTVAKCIVDVLVERAGLGETLDRTHTPPAPVMTRSQQRIAALINGLERDSSMSGVFELVRAGIGFNLFRLGYAIQLPVVEYLTRMLTVMARLKKDRESVRIMCCDALYFLGRLASNAIHIALSIWPEVFPMHNAQSDVIVNCLVHLIRQDQGPKAMGIKRLFRDYYKYPENDKLPTQLMNELMKQLTKEYTKEVEMTILLIAKRQGKEWAHKHIVHGGLIKFIDDDNCPWISNILTLLGFILRTFPTDDEDKKVATVVEKLCKMLETTQDLPGKEEGIVAALLSLARHTPYFKRIADTILKWKPTQTMRTGTMEQLEAFFKMRSLDWWSNWKNNKSK